jgi:hypothetical protein
VGQFGVRVQAGGDDDVQVDLGRDALDARDVPAKPPHRGVDDGPDSLGPQRAQPLDGVGDPGFLVPPRALAVVLHMFGGQHEDVLVHQRRAEVVHVDRTLDRLHCRHGDLLVVSGE